MTYVLLALLLVALAAIAYAYAPKLASRKPQPKRSTAMTHVLHQDTSDSPGYVRLYLKHPVGRTQASEAVTAKGPAQDPNGNPVEHVIHLHGQREFDVPAGARVRFPDGTEYVAD